MPPGAGRPRPRGSDWRTRYVDGHRGRRCPACRSCPPRRALCRADQLPRAVRETHRCALARRELVSQFLRGDQNADEYLHALAGDHGAYNGFNLLASDLHHLSVVQQPFAVAPAATAQARDSTVCPTRCSIRRGRQGAQPRGALCEALAADSGQPTASAEPYLQLLADDRQAPDWELPAHGCGAGMGKAAVVVVHPLAELRHARQHAAARAARWPVRFQRAQLRCECGPTGEVMYRGRLNVARDPGTVPAPR